MIKILKKETKLFFNQPALFIISSLFVIICSLFLWLFSSNYNIINSGYASLDNFFEIAPWLFLFIIPALSMQLFAQEESNGTLEWLFIQPISISNIVKGKLVALFVFSLFILFPTIFYVYSIFELSTPVGNIPFGQLFTSYLGLILLIFTFCAIGLFASSLTSNTIIAFIISLFLNFIFYFGTEHLASFQIFGPLDYVLLLLNFNYHFSFFLKGILDTKNVIFFLVVISIFYFLTTYAVKLRKLNSSFLSKQYFNKLISSLSILIVIFVGSNFIYSRYDFTQDKRYTLKKESKKILNKITTPLDIEVFLDGEFPANFKELQKETTFILDEFKEINKKINYKLINPSKENLTDSLISLGISPTKIQIQETDSYKEITIFPYAIAKYKKKKVLIPLLTNKIGVAPEEQIKISLENLEYNFINGFNSLIEEKKKNIGILTHHDELDPLRFDGFMKSASLKYNVFPIIPKKNNSLSEEDLQEFKKLDGIVVAKPLYPFSDKDKLVLDQFVMKGGKMLWMVDQINAEMDSLYIKEKILAYPVNLNLTDLFFSYGLRLNSVIIKDLQGSILRLATGNLGGNTQYNNFVWPYSPLVFPKTNHPITKNINPVKLEFSSPIEILNNTNIKKTVLLSSSNKTSTQKPLSFVSLDELSKPENPALYNYSDIPLAVLLEGKFNSAYAQRIESKELKNFINQSPKNKMIVISDGDIGKNQVQEGNPLPLGYDKWINQTFGNEQFLMNCLDYLLDDNSLIGLRSKEIKKSILNKELFRSGQLKYQLINFIFPLLFILFVFLLTKFNRRKYLN